MKKQSSSPISQFAAIAGAMGVLLVGIWILSLPLVAAAPPPPLPPPLPTSAPQPTSPPPTGGFIELQVQFPQTWPWADVHWQELWVVVQWQDDRGLWHDVEGWQGTLEDVTLEEGVVFGYKRWWVANTELAKGPFRWQAYREREGASLGVSEPFHLPDATGKTVQVEVSVSTP